MKISIKSKGKEYLVRVGDVVLKAKSLRACWLLAFLYRKEAVL